VRVAQLQGPATTCADVLASSPATLFGLSSNAGIQHLSLQATVHGSTADVTATQAGRAPVTFVLRPTTADESFSFGAPAPAWRIDAGAGQLFGAPHAAPATAAPRT